MKQYFAKYLPVEGEIKEGDTFKYKDLIFRDDGHIQQIEGRTKVKLFLCSRDIQVGDKFTQKGIDMIHPTARFTATAVSEEWVQDDEEKHYAPATVYKVIGEILTEGIKEGQEFTEKEVQYLTIGETHTY